MGSVVKRLLSPEWIIFVICLITEVVAIIIVVVVYDSICVQAGELYSSILIFILFNACPIIPNVCYVVLIPFLDNLAREPMAVIYNLVMCLFVIIGSVVLVTQLTYCGNTAQGTLFMGALCGIIAGVGHLLNAVWGHYRMSKEETYIRR